MDIIVTIPKSQHKNVATEDAWIDKMLEKGVETFSYWKVHRRPKDLNVGDRVYFIVDGEIICWHEFVDTVDDFTCEVTGQYWPGLNLKLTNPAVYLDRPVAMKGFQGIRYTQRI